jgi:hypothetical protein
MRKLIMEYKERRELELRRRKTQWESNHCGQGGPMRDQQERPSIKKQDPRRAKKRYPPAVITVPEGKEEIRDVGVIPKRGRGRPKNPKEVNSPDPHKGSETDGREGVCAYPGKRDATFGTGGPAPPGKGGGGQQLQYCHLYKHQWSSGQRIFQVVGLVETSRLVQQNCEALGPLPGCAAVGCLAPGACAKPFRLWTPSFVYSKVA